MTARDDYPAVATLYDAWLSPAPGREQRPAPEAVRMFIELELRQGEDSRCGNCGGELGFACRDCGTRHGATSRCSAPTAGNGSAK